MAKKRDDAVVKIDREVVRRARIVAASRCQGLNEYLSNRLAPLVAADLATTQQKLAQELDEEVAKDD